MSRLGRSTGGGNGNPLQYSCLRNRMDRGAWWATVHGVSKELEMTEHARSQWPFTTLSKYSHPQRYWGLGLQLNEFWGDTSQPITEGDVRILCTIFGVSSSLKLFQNNKFFCQGWHSPPPKQHGHCGLLGKIPADIHHSRFWGTIPGGMPSWHDPGPPSLCCLPSGSIPPRPQRAIGSYMKQTL